MESIVWGAGEDPEWREAGGAGGVTFCEQQECRCGCGRLFILCNLGIVEVLPEVAEEENSRVSKVILGFIPSVSGASSKGTRKTQAF